MSPLRLGGAGAEQQQLCGRRLGGRFLLTNSFIKRRGRLSIKINILADIYVRMCTPYGMWIYVMCLRPGLKPFT